MDTVMQRENERGRLTVDGWCTDDGAQCTLLVVAEVGGTWALYPHGWGKFGVRLAAPAAETLAAAIQSGGAR